MSKVKDLKEKHQQNQEEIADLQRANFIAQQKGELLEQIATLRSSASLYLMGELATALNDVEKSKAPQLEDIFYCDLLVKIIKQALTIEETRKLAWIYSFTTGLKDKE